MGRTGFCRVSKKQAFLALLGILVLGSSSMGSVRLMAQRSQLPNMVGYPYDWSHHRSIYSQPKTVEAALAVQKDPRFWHQFFRRNAKPGPGVERASDAAAGLTREAFPGISLAESDNRQGDRRKSDANEGAWGESLGAVAPTVGAGRFPRNSPSSPRTTTPLVVATLWSTTPASNRPPACRAWWHSRICIRERAHVPPAAPRSPGRITPAVRSICRPCSIQTATRSPSSRMR